MPINAKICTIAHCNAGVFAKGFCSHHYYANRKYGDPTKVLLKQHHGLSLSERFAVYTKQGPGCWEWIGHRDPQGYGRLNVDGKPVLAHRISYLLKFGDFPDHMHVLHKCDTPKCVNPDHLFLGTQADNTADMHAKGRARKRGMKGEEHPMSKLNADIVRAIRKSRKGTEEVAKLYGISETTVADVRKRRTWDHVK